MDTLPRELVIQNILTRAPQLGHTCKEFYIHLPKISPDQKENIRFPSPQNKNPIQIKNGNLNFEYEARIDFKKLDEMIEDNSLRELRILTKCPIFLEIKRIFEIILKYPLSIMDGWKYKSKFIDIIETHDEAYKYGKNSVVKMKWMDSFVLSFIFYLYHSE
jgi:hypothetical protein